MSFLSELHIENVRNIPEQSLRFSDMLVIFTGLNGSGKTSVLEAIHLLSLPKSFRTSNIGHVASKDMDFLKVRGVLDNEDIEVAFMFNPVKKRILKFKKANVTLREYLNLLPIVTFTPEDIHMIELGPALRREFMDKLLCKIDYEYLQHLTRFEQTLASRNALLKSIRDGNSSVSELAPFDNLLIEHSSHITYKRYLLKEDLVRLLPTFYLEITDTNKVPNIDYRSKIYENSSEKPSTITECSHIYKQLLESERDKDIHAGSTLIGPHRDDLRFTLDNFDAEHFCSRGEVRSLILSLKLAEIRLVQDRLERRPIILLDDVFSELDEKRQKHLLHNTANYQTFVSTTSLAHLDTDTLTFQEFRIANGRVQTII